MRAPATGSATGSAAGGDGAAKQQDVKPSAAGDIVPLSRRVAALTGLRVLICVIVLGLLSWSGRPVQILSLVIYLVASAAFGTVTIAITRRGVAVAGFGLLLCVDGVAVQYAQLQLGPGLAGDLVFATFMAAVCLLGSFRTGIKLAIWQSMLLVVQERGGGILGATDTTGHANSHRLAAELIMAWLLVIVICSASSLSERELRRRRYDAESLQIFAAGLHRDDDPILVLRRVTDFLVRELDAGRVLVCSLRSGALVRIGGHGLALASGAPAQQSALLTSARRAGHPARLLRLDPLLDPWIDAQLPKAQRLIVLPLAVETGEDPVWVLFEHRGRRGTRVERRVLATAGQACATAGLALGRASLFQRSRKLALTDVLTGLANRRAFDQRFAELIELRERSAKTPSAAVILVDIDHFKSVNDDYGHQVGDQVLASVGAVLGRSVPAGAMAARYGGEEFAVLLPNTSLRTAVRIAEEMRIVVSGLRHPHPITASFGVAVITGIDAIVEADRALYQAKAMGRDKVVMSQAALLEVPCTTP